MSLLSKESLLNRIRRSKESRRRLVDSNVDKGIAFQIRATRDKQKMSQADLARMTGMTQNNVSRLESPDYGKQTLSSLKRIADALDVALIVRFVPFSQYIDWLSGTPRLDEGLDSNAIAVSSFEKEEEANLFEQNAFLGQLIMTSVGITVSMYVFPSGIIQPATTFTYGKTQLNTTGLPLENGKHLEIIGASPLQNILPGYQCQQESEEFYARAK